MHILVSTDTTMHGGVDGYVVDLVNHAKKSGHKVTALIDDCAGADNLANTLGGIDAPALRLSIRWQTGHTRTGRSDHEDQLQWPR